MVFFARTLTTKGPLEPPETFCNHESGTRLNHATRLFMRGSASSAGRVPDESHPGKRRRVGQGRQVPYLRPGPCRADVARSNQVVAQALPDTERSNQKGNRASHAQSRGNRHDSRMGTNVSKSTNLARGADHPSLFDSDTPNDGRRRPEKHVNSWFTKRTAVVASRRPLNLTGAAGEYCDRMTRRPSRYSLGPVSLLSGPKTSDGAFLDFGAARRNGGTSIAATMHFECTPTPSGRPVLKTLGASEQGWILTYPPRASIRRPVSFVSPPKPRRVRTESPGAAISFDPAEATT